MPEGYDSGNTLGMKVAISIPDNLFHEAETVAEDLGLSRSGLYGRALAEFVKQHRGQIITDRLNAVYSDVDSALDPGVAALQAQVWKSDPYIMEAPESGSAPPSTAPPPPADHPGDKERGAS